MIEVRRRDADICAFCGLNMKAAHDQWRAAFYSFRGQREWAAANPKPRPNYDHIIPFSEGGMTVLENMRTLCEPCHKKRTREWHKNRKTAKQPEPMTN